MTLSLRAVPGGCTFAVRVQPGAPSDALLGSYGTALRVRVSAPPERGRANAAVAALLAEHLGVAARDVAILAGQHGRQKTVRVAGLSPEEVRRRLGLGAPGG